MDTDSQGRLMVHGLLLGTLPTILGGRMNFLAREITLEFLRPVFTGEPIRCDVVLTQWEPTGDRILVAAEWSCVNREQATVMRGRASGAIRTVVPPA